MVASLRTGRNCIALGSVALKLYAQRCVMSRLIRSYRTGRLLSTYRDFSCCCWKHILDVLLPRQMWHKSAPHPWHGRYCNSRSGTCWERSMTDGSITTQVLAAMQAVAGNTNGHTVNICAMCKVHNQLGYNQPPRTSRITG